MLAQTLQDEWVVDFGCTNHMDKDASLFSSLDVAIENKIFVDDNFVHDIDGHGDISY